MPPPDRTLRYPYGRFQFVWWRYRWWMLWPVFLGPSPNDGPAKGHIYQWRAVFGPLEVRRWTPNR